MIWQEQGACWDSNTHIFFPIRSEMTKGEYNDAVSTAKAICDGCVVKERCAQEGDKMDYGIWGGIVR